MLDLFDSPGKIAIWAVLIIVLFGARKLPVAARSLGQSMRILKREVQGLHDDDESEADARAPQPAPAQLQAPAAPAPAAPATAAPATAADHQAQIEALSKQLADLQQSVKTPDGAQAK